MTPDEWRNAGQWFEFSGHQVFMREAGSGPVLVLLHGLPTSSYDWVYVWDTLAARCHLLAPDFLGFGFSDKPAGHAYNIAEQADLIERMLADKGVREYYILAHDYGDTVAQELLARQSESADAPKVLGTCFLNGGLFPETHYPLLIQTLLAGPLGPVIARCVTRFSFGLNFRTVFGNHTQPDKAELDDFYCIATGQNGKRVWPRLMRYMQERRRRRERWVGALQRAGVPLKLINGSVDPVSGRHMAEHYRQLVPDADVTDLPEIGHYPQWEDPESVLEALLPWLDRVLPARR